MAEKSVEFDTVLELCRDRHRRIVLAVLADQDRPLTMHDLTKAILKHNHHTPLAAVSGEDLTAIQTSLYHTHVPKLAAGGFVDYDPERGVVTPAAFDRLQPALSAIVDADPELTPPVGL